MFVSICIEISKGIKFIFSSSEDLQLRRFKTCNFGGFVVARSLQTVYMLSWVHRAMNW